MSKNIVEENPVQQSSAPSQPQGQGATGGQDKIRKQARQLAYDVRYKVKQGFKDGQKTDPASLKRAYTTQLGKSPAPGPVKLLAKKMLIGEEYDFVDISETVDNVVFSAVKRIFTKVTNLEDADGNLAFEVTDVVSEEIGERKYKIRVKDKKTGKSYVRMANRAKISELRKNPNIASVEMTGYGSPYEGEKKKGSDTAAVKSGKGLSAKDYDGDGKKETPEAEYKGSKDKAIKKALTKEHHQKDADGKVIEHSDGTPSSVDEAFIDEVKDIDIDNNTKKVDMMKGKNKITINPNQSEQVDTMEKPKEDSKEKRVRLMKRMILQKKMQAVRSGAGADIVAHNELKGEIVNEKKAAKDYDGDGKIESGTDEYMGSRDKAIKKAMGKKHDCASKVKHEEYGIGNPVKGMHDLDESGNVVHYDVLFDHGVEKNVPVTSLEILEESMHEHVIQGDVIEQKKPKNCGCGQDPCITYGKKDKDDTIEEDADKLASKAYDRAKTLGSKRRSSYEYRKKGSFGPGKNERAGYNLSQSQKSRNRSPETQAGNQTGGGPKSFGYARNKSNPVKSKSVGDTGGMGHQKKADTKITTKKDGKTPLKTPRYKYSTKQRDQMGFQGRMDKRDPKKNPKHTANTQKESYTTNQIRKQDLDSMRDKIRSILENEYKDRDPKTGEMDNKPSGSVEFDGGAVINPIGDPREMPTAINLVKNKLRARGMKL
jgi:hypothetical protein